MADVGVFSRYKGFNDFQSEAKKNSLADAIAMAQIKAYQAKASSAGRGENLPAALQIAKEYEARVAAGDIQGANTIAAFAKTVDKGLQMGADGNYYVAGGYAPALGEIAGVKAGAAQQAKKNVDAVMNPIIAGGEAGARLGQELTYAPTIKQETERAVNEVSGEKEAKTSGAKTATALKAFEALSGAAKKAPSGMFENVLASGANLANIETDSAKAQGAFQAKRGKAEQVIRKLYRVAGSGADTNRDAQPLIDMLPTAYDSESVKAAKIKATTEALNDDIAVTAKFYGKANPLLKPLKPKSRGETEFNARKAAKAPKPRLKYNPSTGEFE